jgi:hypothetical protein
MLTSAAKAISAVHLMSGNCTFGEAFSTQHADFLRPTFPYGCLGEPSAASVDAFSGRPMAARKGCQEVSIASESPATSFQRGVFLTSSTAPAGIITRNICQLTSSQSLQYPDKGTNRDSTTGNESPDVDNTQVASVADLCDVYPSNLLLLKHLCYEPLRDQLNICQQRAVIMLLSAKHFHLAAKLTFLRDSLLLGQLSFVFEPVRELLLLHNLSAALSPAIRSQGTEGAGVGGRGSLWRSKESELVRSICGAIEGRIHTYLPAGLSESMVSVDVISLESREDRPQPSFAGSTLLVDQLLQALSVQVHMSSPLVEVITGPHIEAYNTSMRSLLRCQMCLWSGEILWKKITTAYLPLVLFCSQKHSKTAVASDGGGSRVGAASLSDPRQMFGTCASGVQWLLHVSKALLSFYLNYLHNTHLSVLREDLAIAQSVGDLVIAHDRYAQRVAECVTFLSPYTDSFLSAALYAAGRLDEAFIAAEAAQTAADGDPMSATAVHSSSSSASVASRSVSFSTATAGILRSRLGHTSRAFGVTRDRIRELVSVLDDITSDAHPFLVSKTSRSGHSSLQTGSPATGGASGEVGVVDSSKTLPWHVTIQYAQSLKALIGDGAGARLKESML